MNFSNIDIGETHIRLTTDLPNPDLNEYIKSIRRDLKSYIMSCPDFTISFEPLKFPDDDLSFIVEKMYESSIFCDVGPMACVAGTISEMALDYLINSGSEYSIVENGGDIALINNKKVLCGIFSNNHILGNNIAFEIKPRKKMLGICTSSGKIGHSISFGVSDSVTVISKFPSVADGLATRIANEVRGEDSEEKVNNALECSEHYSEFFNGVLIVSDEHVATVGRLPKIVETNEFQIKL